MAFDIKMPTSKKRFQGSGGGGNIQNQMMMLMMRNQLQQENAQMKNQQMVGQKEAEAEAKQLPTMKAGTVAMKDTLTRAKQVFDTVPRPEPGWGGKRTAIGNFIKGWTGEIPQIGEYDSIIEPALSKFARVMYDERGTMANQDINRMYKIFSDIKGATKEQASLRWRGAIEQMNNFISGYKKLSDEFDPLDVRELMSSDEIGRSAILRGEKDFSSYTDEEIEAALDQATEARSSGRPHIIPQASFQILLEEAKRRG